MIRKYVLSLVFATIQMISVVARKKCTLARFVLVFQLILAGQCAYAFHYVVDTSSAAPMTGLWWNEDESGWGVSLTQQYDIIFVTIFTYDSTGKPIWYVASKCAITEDQCIGELYKVSGGTPITGQWDSSAKNVDAIGNIGFNFTDIDTGTMYFSIEGVPGRKSISRQKWSPLTPTAPMNALWWNEAESGWGVTINQQSKIAFAAMFTYDANGFATWLVASNCVVTGDSCTGALYEVTGGSTLVDTWDSANIVVNEVGTVTFNFADTDNGTMDFIINNDEGSKRVGRQILATDRDTDDDGLGNREDMDDDGDGILDLNDAYPLISIGVWPDADSDGAPDHCVQFGIPLLPGPPRSGAHDIPGGGCPYTHMLLDPLSLNVVNPGERQVTGKDLVLSALVTSDSDIQSVTALFNGQSITLDYSSETYCTEYSCGSGYKVQLPLANLTTGNYSVTVSVVDAMNRTSTVERSFILDEKPVLNVVEPSNEAVGTPIINYEATCSDDVQCEVFFSYYPYEVYESAMDSLSGTLDLSLFMKSGQGVYLRFEARDSSNQSTFSERLVYLEDYPHYALVKSFPNHVSDFDGERVLVYSECRNCDANMLTEHKQLQIHEISSDSVLEVGVLPGRMVSGFNASLTPVGVFYSAYEPGASSGPGIFDWNNSHLFTVGPGGYSTYSHPTGDYVTWRTWDSVTGGVDLWLRQFSTKTDSLIGIDSSGKAAPNGVVGYGEIFANRILSYSAGVIKELSSQGLGVETDGVGFVYAKFEVCCELALTGNFAIAYHDGRNEILLTTYQRRARNKFFSGARGISEDYAINNGWVAFTDLGIAGQTRLWVRDPDGNTTLRLRFASYGKIEVTIEALSPNGEVMYFMEDRRYLSRVSGELIELGTNNGWSKNINGVWYVVRGNSIFRVLGDP